MRECGPDLAGEGKEVEAAKRSGYRALTHSHMHLVFLSLWRCLSCSVAHFETTSRPGAAKKNRKKSRIVRHTSWNLHFRHKRKVNLKKNDQQHAPRFRREVSHHMLQDV